MGQQEVIDVLKKQTKALSRTEIAEIMDWNVTRVSMVIQKLLDDPFGEIDFLEVDRKKAKEIYGCKRKLRIYYYNSR